MSMLILRLQGLPRSATREKLAALLEEQKIPHSGCNVELNASSGLCDNGFGQVNFSSRQDCKQQRGELGM